MKGSILSESFKQAILGFRSDEAEVRFGEPMSRHTSLRIGGPLDIWIAPSSIKTVARLRELCHQENIPCFPLGLGTNLLVKDGGIRGVGIAASRLQRLHTETEKMVMTVQSGVSTGKVLSTSLRLGWGGAEFLAGVPGSVGGGVIMNAGTLLGEFKDIVTTVEVVDAQGRIVSRSNHECGFAYRTSTIPSGDFVTDVALQFKPRDRQVMDKSVRELRERRRAREPHAVANAGSIFKNPPGDYAGRLIEACGLKGQRIGQAEVSSVHANWIVNVGGATAADFLALTHLVRDKVAEKFQITLELEVKVIGEESW